MAFVRRRNDPQGWPRVIEEFGVFHVRPGFYHAGLTTRAETLCRSLNLRRNQAEDCAPAEYRLTPSGGLRLALRDADNHARVQMERVYSGDRQSAKTHAIRMRALLAGGDKA